jgi:hypothetical protein
MEKKSGKQSMICLLAMIALAALLFIGLRHPAEVLTAVLVSIFVLVVVFDGAKRRALLKKLGPSIRKEIQAGQEYVADVPPRVLSLLQEGKKIEAIKYLRKSTGMDLCDAANKMDEMHLRLSMGQTVQAGRSEE